ncbi:MAG: hypothetical protein RLZZ320_799 [Actinomycetota bacterium]|jgi:M6 family metalloprotease-like protein
MKFGRAIATALSLALVASNPAFSAVKPGATCKKVGQKTVSKGKTYTCVKSGKKLVWNKGKSQTEQKPSSESADYKSPLGSISHQITYQPPLPISGMPKTQVSPLTELADIEYCKIKDAGVAGDIPNNPQRHFVSGFPNYKERANFINNATLQFVAIDFSDLPGQRSPAEDLKPVTTFLTEFFNRQSSKKTAIEFRIPNKYIRMPKPVMDYELAVDFFSGKWKPETSFNYVKEAISVADPVIDFTGASMFAVVVPAEVTRQQIAAFVAQSGEPGQQIVTAEGGIYNFLIMAGPVGTPDFELLNWAHEYGHLFGLTDIRNTIDVTRQDSSDLGMLDLMNSMLAPELLAWQRFIMGILNDDQVRCVMSTKALTHRIIPIAQPELQPKMVVIPLSEYRAIAIESRRSHGYDRNLGTLNEGVFVYSIDTSIPYRYSTMKLIPSPSAFDMVWKRDAALKIGESITFEGWKITYVETGSFGDVVRTERITS